MSSSLVIQFGFGAIVIDDFVLANKSNSKDSETKWSQRISMQEEFFITFSNDTESMEDTLIGMFLKQARLNSISEFSKDTLNQWNIYEVSW